MDNEETISLSDTVESDTVESDTVESDTVADEATQSEPLVIETKGKWQPFEAMTG